MKIIFFTTFLFLFSNVLQAQPFEKTFTGWWASTSWTFEFHNDGTYRRISAGHYGNTTVEGRYNRKGDSLRLTEFENTHGTVNEHYVLDTEGKLIDLALRYDYAPLESGMNFYNSRTRDIKYPQTDYADAATRAELEKVLNLVLNSEKAVALFNFNRFPERKLYIARYGHLQADIQVGNRPAVFMAKETIKEPFFIEIEDINQNPDRVSIELYIHGENAHARFYVNKQNGSWTLTDF